MSAAKVRQTFERTKFCREFFAARAVSAFRKSCRTSRAVSPAPANLRQHSSLREGTFVPSGRDIRPLAKGRLFLREGTMHNSGAATRAAVVNVGDGMPQGTRHITASLLGEEDETELFLAVHLDGERTREAHVAHVVRLLDGREVVEEGLVVRAVADEVVDGEIAHPE